MVLSMSSVLFAQENDSRSKFMFGIKAGTNYSNVYDSQGEKFAADSKFGFAAGAFFSIPFGKYIGIQPEVMYSQRGFKGSGVFLGSAYEFSRTTSYIDLPIFFAIKPIERLTLLVGPQYSYLLDQKDDFKSSTMTLQQAQAFTNDNIRKNTLCLVGGFDVNLGNVVLGARAGWDLQSNNGDGTSSNPRYKNAWLQGTFGFRF